MAEWLDDAPLCEDMACPYVFVQADCSPARCHAADLVRKQMGAIYMIGLDDEANFLGLLPGTLRS